MQGELVMSHSHLVTHRSYNSQAYTYHLHLIVRQAYLVLALKKSTTYTHKTHHMFRYDIKATLIIKIVAKHISFIAYGFVSPF